MWKKIGKFLLALAAIGASAFAIFTWYKNKKENLWERALNAEPQQSEFTDEEIVIEFDVDE